MDLRAGLSLAARGLLFVMINLFCTLNGKLINLFPNFIGWVLLFLAYDSFGVFTKGRKYLEWLPFLLAAATLFDWIANFFAVELLWLTVACGVLTLFYGHKLFCILRAVAQAHRSALERRILFLHVLQLSLYAALFVLSILYYKLPELENALKIPVIVLFFADLLTAVFTCMTIFKLRKEIPITPGNAEKS